MAEQLPLPPELLPHAPRLTPERLLLEGMAPSASPRAIIMHLRGAGVADYGVARRLNLAGVPTTTGRGRWDTSSVRHHADPDKWNAYMRAYRARRKAS